MNLKVKYKILLISGMEKCDKKVKKTTILKNKGRVRKKKN